jgi:tetratricopeptide (TPR) repeat protein
MTPSQTFEDYLNQGIANAEAGNLEEAILDFTKAIDLKPDYANVYFAYFCRGHAYFNLNDLEQAIRDYAKAIELNPARADAAYLHRGRVCAESSNPEQAILDFERYLQLAPNASNREAVMNSIKQLKSELPVTQGFGGKLWRRVINATEQLKSKRKS